MRVIEFILTWAWIPLMMGMAYLWVLVIYTLIKHGPPPYDPDPTSEDWINNFPWGAL